MDTGAATWGRSRMQTDSSSVAAARGPHSRLVGASWPSHRADALLHPHPLTTTARSFERNENALSHHSLLMRSVAITFGSHSSRSAARSRRIRNRAPLRPHARKCGARRTRFHSHQQTIHCAITAPLDPRSSARCHPSQAGRSAPVLSRLDASEKEFLRGSSRSQRGHLPFMARMPTGRVGVLRRGVSRVREAR